jgi:predicted nucleic acid-binding protein
VADGATFVDTSILVFAHDASEPYKQPIARARLEELWVTRSGVLSSQVLQEFYAVATRIQKLSMSPAEAREIIELYSSWSMVSLEPALLITASRLHERHAISWWDALIVEAARVAGAHRLLTEDLQDGQVIEGVRIEDPFLSALAGP